MGHITGDGNDIGATDGLAAGQADHRGVGQLLEQGLANALDRLASGERDAQADRDEAMRDLRDDEYLAGNIDDDETVRLIQISAPVFEPSGDVYVSLMILGTGSDISGAEVNALGSRLAATADEVGARQRGSRRSP